MLRFALLLLIFWSVRRYDAATAKKESATSVLRSETTGDYYLANHTSGTYHRLDSPVTAHEINGRKKNITIVSDEVLQSFTRGDDIIVTLKLREDTPDERMRVIKQLAELMEPVSHFISEEWEFPITMINPSIVVHHGSSDIALVAYRQRLMHGDSMMGWFPLSDALSGNFANFVPIELNVTSSGHDRFGKEDPRLIKQPNGNIGMLYNAKDVWNGEMWMHYVELSVTITTTTTEKRTETSEDIEVSVKASEPCILYRNASKNWVPFVSSGKIYFIERLSPMHIYEYLPEECGIRNAVGTLANLFSRIEYGKSGHSSNSSSDSGKKSLSSSSSSSSLRRRRIDQNVEKVKEDDDDDNPETKIELPFEENYFQPELPWRSIYGSFIRGGSPAILVNGLYVSFFHSVASHWPFMRTYYMGAVTFCPSYPFKMHSISEFAIINDEWYDWSWTTTNKAIDYITFPVGLELYPDRQHFLLSMGRMDQLGVLLKINVNRLLSTLQPVEGGSCFY